MTTAPQNSADAEEYAGRDHARARHRERMAAFRDRNRTGKTLVSVEVSVTHARALQRLGLFDEDGGKDALAWAVVRFLDTAPHVVAIGDALYPESEGWEA